MKKLFFILDSINRRKKVTFLLLALLLFSGICRAQNQWDNWIFGNKAYVKFAANSTALPTSTATRPMNNWAEGVSSVSDATTGALLFYTNGVTVYRANGAVMTGGTGLNGNGTSTESALIVPDPGNANRYYIFTNGAGLCYSIVDMTIPSVVTLNTVMQNNVSEKVAAIKVCGENAYWIVAHTLGNNNYLEWKLTSSGVSAVPVATYSLGISVNTTGNAGHLKFSPDGSLMAAAHVDLETVELFSFNPSNGVISNIGSGVTTTYPTVSSFLPYGVEFSPDSKKLYVTILGQAGSDTSRIYQYNVSNPALAFSLPPITIHKYLPTGLNYGYCSLQLGPDDRIYTTRRYIDSIYYIPSPNSSGSACGFSAANNSGATRIFLFGGPTTKALMGLPNFPSRFSTCCTANAGRDTSICTGYATQLNGSTSVVGSVTYSWAPATGLSCTSCQNPIAAPLVTTTYTLTTSGSCSATATVTVTVNKNCCSAFNNNLFTTITSNTTISSNTYYSGKYFVAPGVIITVTGALLDLTNVDMVFGPCAGIEFHNGASLNANNSVFRPCDNNLWWSGFSFFDGSTGTVNSCTFENAGEALGFDGTNAAATYSNITNNLFLNCRKGVKIVAGTDFLESITNNVFTVDFNNIDYSIPSCSGVITTPNEYHCIEVNASDLTKAYISQNQFINNQVGATSTSTVSGIYYYNVSGSVISQNTFTNLYRDIDASASTDFSIENNEMELLQFTNSKPIDYQIRLSECSYVWVTGNHLVNSKEFTDGSISTGAIYSELNSYLNIKDNTVDGGDNGILSYNDNFSSITGNEISGVNYCGIYLSNLQESEINCNQIHLQTHPNLLIGTVGIGYVPSSSNQIQYNNSILSNCIFDAGYAILLSSLFATNPGPVIANNYFYNYSYGGIFNAGYAFNLGSGIATYAIAGHNTFASNKHVVTTVYDIYSITPLTAYGNYGIATVNSSVTTVGNNAYSSTASCGQQIGPNGNNQNNENICDLFYLNLQDLVIDSFGAKMMLSSSFEEKVNANRAEFPLSQFVTLLQLLQSSSPSEADKLYEVVKQNGWLSATDFGEFSFYHHLFAMDFPAASADLAMLNGNVDADWYTVKNTMVNHLADGSFNHVSDQEIQNLTAIEQSTSPFAADARELLQATVGGFDYHFKAPEVFKGIEAGSSISVSQAQLNIYPNPARDETSVQYVLPDGLSDATLVLCDLSGKLIETQNLESSNSVAVINLQNLSTGNYIVALEGSGRILLRSKLVKD